MTDFSNINWSSLSDNAILEQLGSFIKAERLGQNRSQSEVAEAAGISRSTLSLLERGEGVNLATLIQVLRVLDRLNALDGFQIEESIRPLELAKQKREQRQRASRSSKDDSDW
jgi:transcriptional regulator with XRE-family HTH domain